MPEEEDAVGPPPGKALRFSPGSRLIKTRARNTVAVWPESRAIHAAKKAKQRVRYNNACLGTGALGHNRYAVAIQCPMGLIYP